jgi:hypothetical protein
MNFSTFSSFLQKLTFQCFKRQLKSLSFVFTFGLSAFQLKKSAKKQEQTCLAFEILIIILQKGDHHIKINN